MDAEDRARLVPLESAATVAAVAAAPPGSGLARFYGFQVVSELTFTSSIWIIFLQGRGFSLSEIGLAESFFHLAPVTLELPSGSFADVLGRKWSLALGALLIAISTTLIFVADSLWILLPAMYLNGASYAFRSGAQQAFLFDSMAALPGGNRFSFTSLFGKLNAVAYIAIAASSALGGVLAERDFALPFGLTIGAGLAAAWLAAGLREPEPAGEERLGMGGTIVEALRIIRGNRQLLAIVVFVAALWTVSTLVHLYGQAVLTERGLPPSQIGVIFGAILFATALGAWLAGRLTRLGSFRAWTIAATLVVAASGVLMGGGPLVLAIGGLAVTELFAGAYEPMVAQRVNEAITSAQRATIISVEGFLFSFTMIWAFPLFGFTAERWGWLPAYAAAGGSMLILLAVYLLVDRGNAISPAPGMPSGEQLD
jgi:MFS family permease